MGTEGISYSFRLRAADRVGNTSEWTTSGSSSVQSVTKYYYFGSQRVALRRSGAGSKVYYLHGDHLGSTSLVTDQSGSTVSESRYAPFGSVRWARGASLTDFSFTGQRQDGFGLMDYHARYYSPVLGRFVSADTLVPGAGNPLAWDRYAYVNNNPVRDEDPSGHSNICDEEYHCYDTAKKRWKNPIPMVDRLAWPTVEREELIKQNLKETVDFFGRVVYEPYDWARVGLDCLNEDCTGWDFLGLLPLLPAGITKYGVSYRTL